MTQQHQAEINDSAPRRLLSNRCYLRAVMLQTIGDSEEERTAARYDHTLTAHRPTVLYEGLQAAWSDDTGQGPARERQKQFAGTCREYQLFPMNLPAATGTFDQQLARSRN